MTNRFSHGQVLLPGFDALPSMSGMVIFSGLSLPKVVSGIAPSRSELFPASTGLSVLAEKSAALQIDSSLPVSVFLATKGC